MSGTILQEQIRLYAKQLKLPIFADYEQILRQSDPSAGFGDLLLELMKAECATRQENQTRRRLKAAAFPYQKTLDEFDFSQLNPAVSPAFLRELATCQFIQDRQNVILIGNPGRGKTHLAIALDLVPKSVEIESDSSGYSLIDYMATKPKPKELSLYEIIPESTETSQEKRGDSRYTVSVKSTGTLTI